MYILFQDGNNLAGTIPTEIAGIQTLQVIDLGEKESLSMQLK